MSDPEAVPSARADDQSLSRGGRGRAAEAVAVGVAGGVVAAAAGSLVGLLVPAAGIGALNGVIGGARRVYAWRRPRGVAAFVLDSTWALPMSAAALVAHLVAATQPDAGYVPELSERADRHVYERGLRFRKGFAITIGNVVNHAGDVRGSARRMRLVTDHEHVHVWQGRWCGPLYPLLYIGWSLGGAVVGAAVWAVGRRDEPFTKVVETCAYYLNPFEWWAYSRDDHWPPAGIVAGMEWPFPAVRPFSARPAPGREPARAMVGMTNRPGLPAAHLESAEEVEDGAVELRRCLLLGPVADALEHHGRA